MSLIAPVLQRIIVSEQISVVPTPPSEAPAAPGLQHPNMLRDIIETMVLVAIAFLVVNALIGRFRIEQVSMLPNLHEGEYVIVDKVSYAFRQPERGEIVVLKNPNPGQPDLIKRVIGLPGETIDVRGGQARRLRVAEGPVRHAAVEAGRGLAGDDQLVARVGGQHERLAAE